jgi:hypothetical protein
MLLQKNQEKVLHEKNTNHQYMKNCKEKHAVPVLLERWNTWEERDSAPGSSYWRES